MFSVSRKILIGASALASLVLAFGAQAQGVAADYHLHAGDKLDISVWKETEMQRPSVVIPPDGKVSFPLAGQIMAAGHTVGEVRDAIQQNLKVYIPEPVVTVSVVETAGNVAYVIGQVGRPGSYPLNPGINVLQALALAGGGTAFAKLDSVIVIRGGSRTLQRVLPFRFSQVSEGKNLDQNVVLESGDVIVVP